MRVLLAAAVLLALPCAVRASAPPPTPAPGIAALPAGADPARDKAVQGLLEAAFGAEAGTATLPGGGREQFAAVLARPLFVHGTAGPFDVYVCQEDGLKKPAEAKKVLQRACDGLAPLAALLAREFPDSKDGGAHLVTGRRFSVVLTSCKPGKKEPAFEQVVALLDRCEDLGFSAYKPSLPVWSADRLAASSVVTWEVAVFNLAHPAIAAQDKAWFEHGLGYEMTLLLASRMLFRGASGPVPPWLLQGLTDELDIEAHGSAWVAAGENSSWSKSTSWHNDGWEGFVPEGGHPPPPVTGPPPGTPTHGFETKVASDAWLERGNSTTRHWSELVADLKSEQPVSLAAMAARQTFTPRDRAWARCVLHLLVNVSRAASPGVADRPRPGLLQSLDRESQPARSGLQDGEPLPLIFARVLGTPVLDELSVRTLGDFLRDIERPEVATRIRELQAEPLLGISNLAAQGEWLYTQPQFDDHMRLTLFLLIQELENYRELREWELLGIQLDKATRAALGASKSFPGDAKARATAADAFRASLVGA